ncbi:MAG: cyclic nucleotide-binding domain-containing protein [Candidatus Omnitrophica bacterium]|nr:cyclic nucleotide-binding domain-containing protein [Candidatus Omnitrophota bacterium]
MEGNKTLEPILKKHPFFKDLKQEYFDFIVGCASNVRFRPDEVIFKEGEPAEKFYLIREGLVAIEVLTGQYDAISIQTIKEGEILGWSWLIPPHRARFNCRAVKDTRAIALDGTCLRNKCMENHELGFELMMRLTKIFAQRLEQTRLQLLCLTKC